MFSALETWIITLAVLILKSTIKNPQSIAKEKAVISTLAIAATELDTALSGTLWSSTPGPTK